MERVVTQWFRTYGGLIRSLVRSFATDHDEMEDLYQEVWVVVVRKYPVSPGTKKLRSWLYSIALNVCKAHLVKLDRRARLFEDWAAKNPPEEPSGVSPSIEGSLLTRRLWVEIGELPRLQRAVVLLRMESEYSTAETAKELQRSEGTIKATLHTALRKLNLVLGPTETEEPTALPPDRKKKRRSRWNTD